MRIVILSFLYPPIVVGGAEKAANLLAEAFARRGDQVTVISLYPEKETITEERNGVQVYRLPLDNIYWPFGGGKEPNVLAKMRWHIKNLWNSKSAKRIGQILDEVKPDVVHTNATTGFSVAVWKEIKKRGIRIVHTLHDYEFLCFHPGLLRNGHTCERQCLDCRIVTLPKKKWSHKIDAVVSVSKAVLATHRRMGYFSGVPGHVIYNIQESLQEGAGESAPRLKNAESKVVTFGFIGALAERKGIGQLLKATTRLSTSDWRLKIAGKGSEDYVAELKRSYPDPRIEWLGFTSAQAFYSAVDVIIVPSIWQDPLPYVVIESFASGKSVICAQSGGLPELATLGKCVMTYPALDVSSLAKLMDQVVLNPSAYLHGGFADEKSREAFSEDSILQQYSSVYANSTPAGTQ
jgi:glycosyltransferase involved in cell wall biosynthesis